MSPPENSGVTINFEFGGRSGKKKIILITNKTKKIINLFFIKSIPILSKTKLLDIRYLLKDNKYMNKTKGFTLIEIMIVIAILGILAALISGNFINSLKKSRDTKRKADLQQIQKALEAYYEDVGDYPASLPSAGLELTNPTNTTKIYMVKLPGDPLSQCRYYYVKGVAAGNTNGYKLYATIENVDDIGPGVLQSGYTGGPSCGASCVCRFGVTSSNWKLP